MYFLKSIRIRGRYRLVLIGTSVKWNIIRMISVVLIASVGLACTQPTVPASSSADMASATAPDRSPAVSIDTGTINPPYILNEVPGPDYRPMSELEISSLNEQSQQNARREAELWHAAHDTAPRPAVSQPHRVRDMECLRDRKLIMLAEYLHEQTAQPTEPFADVVFRIRTDLGLTKSALYCDSTPRQNISFHGTSAEGAGNVTITVNLFDSIPPGASPHMYNALEISSAPYLQEHSFAGDASYLSVHGNTVLAMVLVGNYSVNVLCGASALRENNIARTKDIARQIVSRLR